MLYREILNKIHIDTQTERMRVRESEREREGEKERENVSHLNKCEHLWQDF